MPPVRRSMTAPRGASRFSTPYFVAALALAACLALYLGARALGLAEVSDVGLATLPPLAPGSSSSSSPLDSYVPLAGVPLKKWRRRSRDALIAAFVADAASTGLHWQYDVAAIAKLVAERGGGAPEFLSPPATQFYDAPVGGPSPCARPFFNE